MYKYLTINFGEIDQSQQDLWDCLLQFPGIILYTESFNEFFIQISDDSSTFRKFDSFDDVINYYVDFFISKGLPLEYSKEILLGILQSTFDEDEDAMYDILQLNGGQVQFVYDGEFDLSGEIIEPFMYLGTSIPFCLIQRSDIDVEIKDSVLTFKGANVKFDELFGKLDILEAVACLYIN